MKILFWKLRWLIDVFSDDQIFYVICLDGCNNSATANSNSATFPIMFNDILPRWDGQVWIQQYNDPFPFVIILKLVKQVKVSGNINLLSIHFVFLHLLTSILNLVD